MYENVGDAHVLWELQGVRTAKFETEVDEKTGEKVKHFAGYTASHSGDNVASRL